MKNDPINRLDVGGRCSEHPLCGVHVVLLNEDASERKLLSILLANAGAVVEAFHGPAAALGAIERSRPRAIVLDAVFSGQDDISAADRIFSEECSRGIPVVVVTALADLEARIGSPRLAVFRKPLDVSSFGEAVAKHIELASAHLMRSSM